MEPQSETVWVLVDNLGNPNLYFVRREKPGPNVQIDVDEDWGPHKWIKYRLVKEA
jgi:hypothetical protein